MVNNISELNSKSVEHAVGRVYYRERFAKGKNY
jgi:hypothetical protein